MKTNFLTFTFILLTIISTGCSSAKLSSANSTIGNQASLNHHSDLTPDRMLVWEARLTLRVDEINDGIAKASAIADHLKGFVTARSDGDDNYGSMDLKIPAQSFRESLSGFESIGDVEDRSIKGEDVTDKYIDTDARLKNKKELRDRLRTLLAKATVVKDVISIETELNRIQSEIDSMEGQIKSLKGQVDYSSVHLVFRRQEILGPLGYVFHGLRWAISKLFVIRD
jgi:hypothetical protein